MSNKQQDLHNTQVSTPMSYESTFNRIEGLITHYCAQRSVMLANSIVTELRLLREHPDHYCDAQEGHDINGLIRKWQYLAAPASSAKPHRFADSFQKLRRVSSVIYTKRKHYHAA